MARGRKRTERNFRVNVINPGGILKEEDARRFAKWFLRWAIDNGAIKLPGRRGQKHEDVNCNLRKRLACS